MNVRRFFRRGRRDDELQREMEQHIELEREWNQSRGMSADEADRQARIKFGSARRVREDVWQSNRVPFIETFVRDLRYAFRTLRKSPGYTTMAVLTLGLGIGANTAIFTVINGVLLRPLPYAKASRLMHLDQTASRIGPDPIGFSVPEVMDYSQQTHAFTGMAEYHSMTFTLLGGNQPERVATGVVSSNFFDVLGIKPALGRLLTPADESLTAPPVLVLSYAYWAKEFGKDPSVVGRSFTMNDHVHTVVGVAAPMPAYPDANDVFMPTTSCPFRSSPAMIHDRDMRMITVFGRLRDGVDVKQAQSELRTVSQRMALAYPKSYPATAGVGVEVTPVEQELTHTARPTFLMLLGAAGLVLLLACANLANLALARQMRRSSEMALRMALGASTWTLLRALAMESLLVALASGVVGVAIACLSTSLLAAYASRLTPVSDAIRVDGWVLLFALGVSVVTGVLFGTLPGYVTGRNRMSLLSGTSDRAAGSRSASRMRGLLVAAQVAFSFVLLVCAGLMMRSLYNLLSVDPGMKTSNVLSLEISYNWTKYGKAELQQNLFRQILERTRQTPGVEDAAISSLVPLNGAKDRMRQGVIFEGRPQRAGEPEPSVDMELISPDYFRVLGVPVVAGRSFLESDTATAPMVAIVNTQMLHHYWPKENPIGHRVSPDGGKTWATIVGVASSVHKYGLAESIQDGIYFPQAQTSMGSDAHLLLRTKGDPMQLSHAAVAEIHEIDNEQPVSDIRTLNELRRDQLGTPRVTSALLALFGFVALFITVVGVSGTLALAVAEQIKEIGIRLALGASKRQVLSNVVGKGMAPVGAGIIAGFVAALGVGRLLQGMLFGVKPDDPLTLAAVAVGLAVMALAGCALPGRQAMQVDVLEALRNK